MFWLEHCVILCTCQQQYVSLRVNIVPSKFTGPSCEQVCFWKSEFATPINQISEDSRTEHFTKAMSSCEDIPVRPWPSPVVLCWWTPSLKASPALYHSDCNILDFNMLPSLAYEHLEGVYLFHSQISIELSKQKERTIRSQTQHHLYGFYMGGVVGR